jgi:hypothetical protein
MVSKSYSEMIEEAILHLGEVMGSSRQSIWKALSAQYADADYKQFVIRLKKMREAVEAMETTEQAVEATEARNKLMQVEAAAEKVLIYTYSFFWISWNESTSIWHFIFYWTELRAPIEGF